MYKYISYINYFSEAFVLHEISSVSHFDSTTYDSRNAKISTKVYSFK